MDKCDKIYIWHYITLAKMKLRLRELNIVKKRRKKLKDRILDYLAFRKFKKKIKMLFAATTHANNN